MAYCTANQLKLRYNSRSRELAQLTGDASGVQISDDKLDEAIVRFANTSIDACLRKRFDDLSLLQENSVIQDINEEGAFLQLIKDTEAGFNDNQQTRWLELHSILSKIASGSLELEVMDEHHSKNVESGFFSTDDKLFGRGAFL